MIGKIIEGLDGITKVTYFGTGVGWIEFFTEGNSDDKPDSLILIFWCLSVELCLLLTN